MGKFTQGVSTAGLRTGNTIATPVRIGGELLNAVGNIPRQGISATKNIAEVSKQTRDALIHNFTNFSKVDGKWYQKMLKVPLNLVSAVSRRPAMIAAGGVASGLNQGVRQPFKKLLYTPGKMFKGMRNATRIFSKKKGFDFTSYDTHETSGDTWVNKIREKSLGFLGATGGSAQAAEVKKPEVKKTEAKPEVKPVEVKKSPEAKEEKTPVVAPVEKKPAEVKKPAEIKKETPETKKEKPEEKKEEKIEKKSESESGKEKTGSPKNISTARSRDDTKKTDKDKAEKKDKDDQEKKFPERKNLDRREKAKNEKEYTRILDTTMTKEGILERGKKEKKGDTLPEIISTVKKENPTFAGYMEDEILNKAA